MFKTLQTLMMAGTVAALTACGGGGGDGGGSSNTPAVQTQPAATSAGAVSTSLSAASVTSPNGTVVLTITLTNTGNAAVSGGAFMIPLPAGAISASTYQVQAPCIATHFSVGTSGFALAGLSIPAGATCVNTLTLTPSTPGTFVFTPTGLTGVSAGTQATLTIN